VPAVNKCDQSGCTVSETGICLLSHPEPSSCPHFRNEESGAPITETTPVEVLPLPGKAARHFPPGLELGIDDAAAIMRAQYSHLVGILGSWNAGKTCFLLSLYLMASRAGLPSSYIFAGSQTLPGFEARARRLRQWSGGALPDQLADHTSLADPRQPSFLHLALRETSDARRLLNIVLTDLPGEWSKNLVDRAATAERFTFLRRADGFIVVVDGPALNSATQHSEIQRTKHLLERLAQTVRVDVSSPLILLISKSDRLNMERPAAVAELEQHARALGFSPEVMPCAAFSHDPSAVPNGLGVFDALEKILIAGRGKRLTASTADPSSDRAFARFGGSAR
jgi:hypothetical protein